MTDACQTQIAIVGTGPAGLMAATAALRAGATVRVFEKRKGPGHKLLVAGSSGLNVTHDPDAFPLGQFHGNYRDCGDRFKPILGAFGPRDWLAFIESDIGIATFKGTSRRYFVEGMKAAALLRAWLELLARGGATVAYGCELADFEPHAGGVRLAFVDGTTCEAKAAVLALGGASWEPQETPLRWPALFARRQIAFTPFRASNTGFRVDWPKAFLAEAEGLPLKNVAFSNQKGSRPGDLVVTAYGLEGTPVYALGAPGPAHVDLKPDLSAEKIFERLSAGKNNVSALKRVKKHLGLCPASFALVAHLAPRETVAARGAGQAADLRALSAWLKQVPLDLLGPQPLEEAISSAGGVAWRELGDTLMLNRAPGVFCAGEMIDWDAPTGGFLIQGSVSQGHVAGVAAARFARQPGR